MTRVRMRAARERVPVRAVGRREDVALLHRLADADRDGLLADRDVQEARELACAEALLDLLLEAPDEEHLAQELAQRLLVEGAFLLDLRHCARQCTFCVVSLVGQWRALADGLPEGWRSAGLRLELREREAADRAAALLGPAQPFRAEPDTLRFDTARDGSATGPDGVTRLLARLDDARIGGTLTARELRTGRRRAPRGARRCSPTPGTPPSRVCPSDWSDLLCELTLLSTDYVERAAVLCIQMNPRRDGDRAALRFRCARVAGYGVSPEMARRCLERCDARGHPRLGHGAARAERHPARRDAGAGLAPRRADRLMADPVSWLLIEPGWEVVGANGERIGKVDEVLGDLEADIWDGLTVDGKYVPAEQVASIVEDRITLAP